MNNNCQIIKAPSILGLRPTGVDNLADTLLAYGLQYELGTDLVPVDVPVLNHLYQNTRDQSGCCNSVALSKFSQSLMSAVHASLSAHRFPVVLGGDCSILIGALPAVRRFGKFGLVFLDAHADFYLPHQSPTGEVADMDLAIVTGRGPAILADLAGQRPYVEEQHVIHLGQRDREEAAKFGMQDIADTSMNCISNEEILSIGMEGTLARINNLLTTLPVTGYWIHLDTDVLSDDVNSAVDYRIPGGIKMEQLGEILTLLLSSGKMIGLSVTILNPTLDVDGLVGRQLVRLLGTAFRNSGRMPRRKET